MVCRGERKIKKNMNTNSLMPSDRFLSAGDFGLSRWLSRLVMVPPALVFALISIRFLTHPSHATPGVSLNTPEAFTDTRVIGAWMLTLLSLLITFLFSNERLWLGHLELAVFMGVTLIVWIFG